MGKRRHQVGEGLRRHRVEGSKGGRSEGIKPLVPVTPGASFTPELGMRTDSPLSLSRLDFCHLKLKKSYQFGQKK